MEFCENFRSFLAWNHIYYVKWSLWVIFDTSEGQNSRKSTEISLIASFLVRILSGLPKNAMEESTKWRSPEKITSKNHSSFYFLSHTVQRPPSDGDRFLTFIFAALWPFVNTCAVFWGSPGRGVRGKTTIYKTSLDFLEFVLYQVLTLASVVSSTY